MRKDRLLSSGSAVSENSDEADVERDLVTS